MALLQVRELVAEQTAEWSEMCVRQVAEEHELRMEHITAQNELLVLLLEQAHQDQLKELESRQERSVLAL